MLNITLPTITLLLPYPDLPGALLLPYPELPGALLLPYPDLPGALPLRYRYATVSLLCLTGTWLLGAQQHLIKSNLI